MRYISFFLLLTSIFSCKISGQINKKQVTQFLNDSAVITGHTGISIYEPATGKYIYNLNADKNFTPSSNIKLVTMYAALKYLGDSLVGIKYSLDSNNIIIYPTGDPTLLHPYFKTQPVVNFLKNTSKNILVKQLNFKPKPYGNGWAWNDYPDYYMAERSPMPIYGNCITFNCNKTTFETIPQNASTFFNIKTIAQEKGEQINVERDFFNNNFTVLLNNKSKENITVPFISSLTFTNKLLSDTIHKNINLSNTFNLKEDVDIQPKFKIYSQPTDSLLKQMMHNSDNFFAEQTLLMVSNEKLGYMSDKDIIDTLLKTDLKDFPSKPRWVDGCGLSRYNLFTPNDFIFLLDKMKTEFGMERLKSILTTGNQGTLKNYYVNNTGFIYAKTGSMSNNVSLSGYLFTKKNKFYIFSIQLNSFAGTGKAGRRAIEKFLVQIIKNN